MSSRPKPVKPNPINQQRIVQVQQELNTQNKAIEAQLQIYRTQQLGNLEVLRQQKSAAIDAASLDAQRNLLLIRSNRDTLMGLLRSQTQAKQAVNQAQIKQKQAERNLNNRSTIVVGNKQKPTTSPIGL